MSRMAQCPRCCRTVSVRDNRYIEHNIVSGKHNVDLCPFSDQRLPVEGHSAADYLRRAYLVTDLAMQVQDRDTSVVWEYLTLLPADEVKRLLMIALAGLRVDQRLEELFGWVCELPVAKAVAS